MAVAANAETAIGNYDIPTTLSRLQQLFLIANGMVGSRLGQLAIVNHELQTVLLDRHPAVAVLKDRGGLFMVVVPDVKYLGVKLNPPDLVFQTG